MLRTLGEGGMGSVFLATDPSIDRLVALKLMRAGFDSGQLRERFAREAKAVGRLHHPNIVTIFEFGEHEGEPFIAMEYVEGQTLASLVGRPDVTLPQTLALMDGLCAGLHYAHRAGIIHRDIKPVNVMLDGEGIVKILDFGIARAAAMSVTQAGTQPGTILGTLNYMSPEQLSGKPVDQRTDIFAVGAVFYEMLAGRQAFPGDLSSGVLQLILMTGPTPIETLRPDLDPAVCAIVNRCLERDADRRYADLGVMRQELAAIRHIESTPRSAGATVILAPGHHAPSGISPVTMKTPGPDTRAAAERTRQAQYDADVNDARLALEREDYTKATEAIARVLGVEPAHPGALAVRAELDAVRQARTWVEDGHVELNRGALTAAAGLVDRALAARPAMPEGLKLRAAIEDARSRAQKIAAAAPTMMVTPAASASAAETLIAPPQPSASAKAAPPPPPVEPPTSKRTPMMATAGVAALLLIAAGGYFFLRKAEPLPPASVPETATSTPAPSPPSVVVPPPPAPTAAKPGPPVPPATAVTEPPASDANASTAALVSAPPAAAEPRPSTGPTVGLRGNTRACNSGNAHACTETGLAYRNGRGIVRDDAAAASFFQRGCDGNDSIACVYLGQLALAGNGVAKDEPKAASLYQKGCDGNAALGCFYLGNMYQNGRGVARDPAKAFTFLARGCDGNNLAACNEAAIAMSTNQTGVPHDDARLAGYLRKACDGQFLASCRNLGVLYEQGRGVPKNEQLAMTVFQKACDGHLGVACTNIGRMFEQGRGVPKSDAEAKIFFSKACDAGDQVGCRLKGGGER